MLHIRLERLKFRSLFSNITLCIWNGVIHFKNSIISLNYIIFFCDNKIRFALCRWRSFTYLILLFDVSDIIYLFFLGSVLFSNEKTASLFSLVGVSHRILGCVAFCGLCSSSQRNLEHVFVIIKLIFFTILKCSLLFHFIKNINYFN